MLRLEKQTFHSNPIFFPVRIKGNFPIWLKWLPFVWYVMCITSGYFLIRFSDLHGKVTRLKVSRMVAVVVTSPLIPAIFTSPKVKVIEPLFKVDNIVFGFFSSTRKSGMFSDIFTPLIILAFCELGPNMMAWTTERSQFAPRKIFLVEDAMFSTVILLGKKLSSVNSI